jgi:hypothetical protein
MAGREPTDMSETGTGGLASLDLWDSSTSWSSATIGSLDTGGSYGVVSQEVIVEPDEPQQAPPGPEDIPAEPALRDRMANDSIFRRLVEQGFDDLDAGRFGPL